MLYIDTVDTKLVQKYVKELGICEGVTSNQAILLKNKQANIAKVIQDLDELVGSGPVHVELTKSQGSDDDLVREAMRYAALSKKVVIKIPMWADSRGLRIAKELQRLGICTNVTCCMSSEQVLLASSTGADFVSLFFNRIKDYWVAQGCNEDEAYDVACGVVETSSRLMLNGSKLIVGSIRKPMDVIAALDCGADIVTVPPNILDQMFMHSKTVETIAEFDKAWATLQEATK